MEESSESVHSGGCWRALPAHEERRRKGEEEAIRQEEREEKDRKGERDSTVQDGSGDPDYSSQHYPWLLFRCC